MPAKTRHIGAMHVVTNRIRRGEKEYTATLLRRSYRQDGKVKKETLANLSHLPAEAIDAIRRVLAGESLMSADDAFEIERSLPAGHVNAALIMARRLGLAELLDPRSSRDRDLCMAMIVSRVISPGSKLSTVRSLGQSTLASELGVEGVDEDDLYAAMDWLYERQARIEDRLAKRHLNVGEMVLYDVSSSYFEGRACPLGKLGYSRDGQKNLPQIVYGLLCDKHGRPVSIEVFSGETHDDKTLPAQVRKVKDRFGLARVTVVTDRGMVTKANIETLTATEGVSWITALKAPTIKKLVRDGIFQPSLFDQQNLGEITDVNEFPGERLIVCRNPLVGAQRARKRTLLLDATEQELAAIKTRVDKGTLLGSAQIGLAVGPALKRFHVKKHFDIHISDMEFTYQRKQEQIDTEAALDGFYILRTNHTAAEVPAGDVVRTYKNLEQAERAFRSLKGPDLQIRPIHHHLENRVRSHVLICMLAYYLTWHLKAAWKPLLFTDENRPENDDPVAKAVRSPEAETKARTKQTTDGGTAHSYQTLLSELATQTRNRTRLAGRTDTFEKLTQPTALQAQALKLTTNAPVVIK
ncbi:IS1634 family transposase [Conexibacter sp. S30A1]|uniref:IS1634 family transposase n=1 Tax=Conexibacter sp. S30A1 TaxID=2937800 RepID=UPI00200F4D0D|nr:IS1634 family transposase [Conexibacter sp. S30A1]